MSKYKVLSSLLRLVTVDNEFSKAATGYSQTLENLPTEFRQEMRETIRRIRKRKTWVNPIGWETMKVRWIMLTVFIYLFALIKFLRAEIQFFIDTSYCSGHFDIDLY
jgi:hypothetical protein